jgi:Fic family protein
MWMDPVIFGGSPSGKLVRAPTGYQAFVPHPLPPVLSWTPSVMAALSLADRALGELAGLGRCLPNPHLLIAPFVHREAVLSSRIEGAQASLSDLYAYEAVQKMAVQLTTFEAPPDVGEVYNYVRALEYGLDRLQSLLLSLRLIREITDQARNRVCRADEVVDAIEEPLGQEGEPSGGEAP